MNLEKKGNISQLSLHRVLTSWMSKDGNLIWSYLAQSDKIPLFLHNHLTSTTKKKRKCAFTIWGICYCMPFYVSI